jgi:hypothetical protein
VNPKHLEWPALKILVGNCPVIMAIDTFFKVNFVMWPSIHKEELAKFKKILLSFGYLMEHCLNMANSVSRRTKNFKKIFIMGLTWKKNWVAK